jgi:hypothetical protein
MSNILKGILNEVSPHNYDSDWDYQNAVARSGKSRSSYRSQEDDDTFDADIEYSKKMYQLGQKQKRDADHDRLATGTNEAKGYYDTGEFYNAKLGGEYGRNLTTSGISSSGHGIDKGANDGQRGRPSPNKLVGISKSLPADPFNRTTGKIPNGIKGKVHSMMGPDDEKLDEISNKKLGQYKKDASADATAADKEGDYKRGDKRMSGIIKATKKQFANDEKQLKEFAPVGGDDREPDEEEILRQLAKMWWLGTEQEMAKAQKTLHAMGWDIGQDESGDDDAGVFVIRVGDENGDSYIAFNHSELEELNEVYNNYHANRTGFSRGQRDDERHDLDTPTQAWGLKINGKVWSKDGKDVTFTSKQAALNTRNAILKNRPDLEIGLVTKGGVAEEKQRLDPSCWKGYKKQGTKMKGDTRVNNCVPVKESSIMQGVKQLDEGWKEKLGAAALTGAMALGSAGASARVTPDGQGGFTGGFKPSATVTSPDNTPPVTKPTASSDTSDPLKGLVRADSADRQAKTITVGGKEYGLVELSPTDIRPRGGQRIVVPQAVLGERGIGNYIGILVGDRVFVISKN